MKPVSEFSIPYEQQFDGLLVLKSADHVLINLTPIWSRWHVVPHLLASGLVGAGAAWSFVISNKPPVAWALHHGGFVFVTIFGILLVVWMELCRQRMRATLRADACGFEYVNLGVIKKHFLTVRWDEVGEIAIIDGPRYTLSNSSRHLRIELINDNPLEIIPLELMRGRKKEDIETVLKHLQLWRQHAAGEAGSTE